MREEIQFGRHWAGTHFGQPSGLVHRSGQMGSGSSSSQSRPSDMDSRNPAFMSRALRLTLLELHRELSSQALTLSREARFIVWHLSCPFLGECQWDSRHFWNCWACVSYGSAPGFHIKNGHVPYSHIRGECQWGSRHFWNCWACVGSGPVLGFHIKNGHVPYSHICGALDKY